MVSDIESKIFPQDALYEFNDQAFHNIPDAMQDLNLNLNHLHSNCLCHPELKKKFS